MKNPSMLVFGGCHVAGYGVGKNASFIHHITTNTPIESQCIYPNFQLKKVIEIQEKIDQDDPDIILLQLGNHEFHASLKKLFARKKKKKSNSDSAEKSSSSLVPSEPAIMYNSVNGKKALNIFRLLLCQFIWKLILRRNYKYLFQLRNTILENPDKEFIVLSPIPCLKKADWLIRSKAGMLYKKIFGSFSNVTFIDLFSMVPSDERFFKDAAHLNRSGHRLLGRSVAREVKIKAGNAKWTIAV
jgi:hypothetical protein